MFRLFIVFAITLCFSYATDDFSEFENEYTKPKERFDPLSGYNRAMTSFNDFTYMNVIHPVSKGYRVVFPKPVRSSIGNFFRNLAFPMRFINNLLQGKIKNSGEELFRFVVNTTIGVGGLGDAGKDLFNVSPHPEDFGQTLGFYGIGSGIPIVIPFLGPSNARDSIGLIGDYFSDPITYVEPTWASFGIKSFSKLNYVSLHGKEYIILRKQAIDLYPFLQDTYEQHREEEIKK